MKKIILTICALFFVFASPLAAMEWGGVLSNDTGIETPDFSNITFKQSNGPSGSTLLLEKPLHFPVKFFINTILLNHRM